MSPKGQIARVCPCDVLLGGGALVDTDREAQGLEHWSAFGPIPVLLPCGPHPPRQAGYSSLFTGTCSGLDGKQQAQEQA